MTCPKFLFASQATSDVVFQLAETVAERLGPTLLHTGTALTSNQPSLEIASGPKYDNSTIPLRALTWTKYLAQAAASLARVDGQPVMLLTSNPPLLPVLGYLYKRLRGWRYVVRVLDVYPDVLHQNGLVGPSHVVFKTWAALNRLAYENADVLITLGPAMAERVSQYVSRKGMVEVIPDWVDAGTLRPVPKSENQFARRHGLVDNLTIMYSGNLGLTHDISGLDAAMAKLGGDDKLRFVFIGGGARESELKTAAEQYSNVLWLPFQPREMLPLSMSSADVGVVTLGRGSDGVSMPSKCYYLMACGCALLGLSSGNNDVKRIIDKYDCGINVEPDDTAGVVAAIERFRDEPEFRSSCGRNARAAVEAEFSGDIVVERYLEILGALRAQQDS
ncbi:MAG: glycosyltransferase family 4 protein [Polyangiaceae bacterium]